MFLIDHYYQIDHYSDCLLLVMSMDTDEIVNLCSAIEYYYEELYGYEADVSLELLNKCLVEVFGAIDSKGLFDITAVSLPISKICEEVVVETDQGKIFASIIDVYHAREANVYHIDELLNYWIYKDDVYKKLKDIFEERCQWDGFH